MTDETGIDAGQQSQASAVEQPVTQQSESTAPAESQQQAQAEKTYTQAQVNAIAAKEARKAAEQAEARSRAEMARSQQAAPQQTAPSVGGIQQMSPEQIQQMIRQEAFQMSREHQAKQIEESWLNSMDAEKQSDPEFADLYDALNIEAQPQLIMAMLGMDNKGKIVKDLAQNPAKYANILTLANGGAFKLAELELRKLSKSIQANMEAQKGQKVDPPLGQVKSSNIGGDDGKNSVTDFRNQDWLRG
jgi:hypothetical protein